jgi:hypothetical protein
MERIIMTSLWIRLIHRHRIERQTTVPCAHSEVLDALTDACRALDVPRPFFLPKNDREWEEFSQTAFGADNFIEHINFDKMEIELIDPDKKKNNDRRNPLIDA